MYICVDLFYGYTGYDVTSYFWLAFTKVRKMAENVASGGFGSNFIGTAFYLLHRLVGIWYTVNLFVRNMCPTGINLEYLVPVIDIDINTTQCHTTFDRWRVCTHFLRLEICNVCNFTCICFVILQCHKKIMLQITFVLLTRIFSAKIWRQNEIVNIH